MKIINVDLRSLIEFIDKNCNGKIELVSPEMRLNIRSKIAQLFVLSDVLKKNSQEIEEIELVCYDPQDTIKLMDFLARGNH